MMYRIKICGVTNTDDAKLAVRHGADAIGVNFWRQSPRWVGVETARSIASVVEGSAQVVGVFVDCPVDEILVVADAVGLDLIQLHGDERGAIVHQLRRPTVQAVRGERVRPPVVQQYLTDADYDESFLCGLLVDAASPSTPGGTGELADWVAASELVERFPRVPIGLAGGLNPRNVADAIRQVRPAAVDVASGVESSRGKKCEKLVAEFIAAAREALDQQ